MNNDFKNNKDVDDTFKSSDDRLLGELEVMLLKQIPGDMQSIANFYKAKDWEKFLFYVHKLHGALCYTHYVEAKSAAKILEKELREKKRDFNKIAECYEAFLKEIEILMNDANK